MVRSKNWTHLRLCFCSAPLYGYVHVRWIQTYVHKTGFSKCKHCCLVWPKFCLRRWDFPRAAWDSKCLQTSLIVQSVESSSWTTVRESPGTGSSSECLEGSWSCPGAAECRPQPRADCGETAGWGTVRASCARDATATPPPQPARRCTSWCWSACLWWAPGALRAC